MPDDTYYSGAMPPQAIPPGDKSAEAEPETPDEDSGTALVPKSFFYGKEPEVGTRETVEIVHVYDDEVAIVCIKEESAEDKSGMERAEKELEATAE